MIAAQRDIDRLIQSYPAELQFLHGLLGCQLSTVSQRTGGQNGRDQQGFADRGRFYFHAFIRHFLSPLFRIIRLTLWFAGLIAGLARGIVSGAVASPAALAV